MSYGPIRVGGRDQYSRSMLDVHAPRRGCAHASVRSIRYEVNVTTFLVIVILGIVGVGIFMSVKSAKEESAEARTVRSLPPSVQHTVAQMDPASQSAFFNEYESKKKKKSIGYLLWFFFGWHYIYVGKVGLQFAYWFTFGGLGFWALVDLFRMPSIIGSANEQTARQALQMLHMGATFASLPQSAQGLLHSMPNPQFAGYPQAQVGNYSPTQIGGQVQAQSAGYPQPAVEGYPQPQAQAGNYSRSTVENPQAQPATYSPESLGGDTQVAITPPQAEAIDSPVGGQWSSDPYGRYELRYYDGSAWTQHVSTSGVQASDPVT